MGIRGKPRAMATLGNICIELPRLGAIRMRPALRRAGDPRAWLEDARQVCEALRLECQGVAALLLVERSLALRLVNLVLGFAPSMAAGPVSRIERGILETVVATMLARLGFGQELRLLGGGACDMHPGVRLLAISVELGGSGGLAYVCGNDEFLLSAWRSREPPLQEVLAVPRLALARTRVPRSALADAEAGDTLVFDGQPPLLPSEPWRVWIGYGKQVILARLDPDGSLCLDGPTDGEGGITPRATGTEPDPEADARAFGADDAHSQAEVVAEIGRLESYRLAELVFGGLRGMGRAGPILLRVGAIPWAEGELVELCGSTAVRITRKLTR